MSFDLNVNVTTRIPVRLASGCGCNGCGKVKEKSDAVKPKEVEIEADSMEHAYEKTFSQYGFYLKEWSKPSLGVTTEYATIIIDPKRVRSVKVVNNGIFSDTIIKEQYQEPRNGGLKALHYKLPPATEDENFAGNLNIYYLQVERKDGSILDITLNINKFLEEKSDVVKSKEIEIAAKSFSEAAEKTLTFQGFYIEKYEKPFGEDREYATVVIDPKRVKNVKFVKDDIFTDTIYRNKRQETLKDGYKALYFKLPYGTKETNFWGTYNIYNLQIENNEGTILGVTLKVDADPEE